MTPPTPQALAVGARLTGTSAVLIAAAQLAAEAHERHTYQSTPRTRRDHTASTHEQEPQP